MAWLIVESRRHNGFVHNDHRRHVLFGRGESHVSLTIDDTSKVYKAWAVMNEQSISSKQPSTDHSYCCNQRLLTPTISAGKQHHHRITARSKSTENQPIATEKDSK